MRREVLTFCILLTFSAQSARAAEPCWDSSGEHEIGCKRDDAHSEQRDARLKSASVTKLAQVQVQARLVTAEPVPSVYAKLVWEQRDVTGKLVDSRIGYWYTADQVQKVNARIDYLEQRAAKECVDQTLEGVKHNVPWLWVTLGVVVGGTAGYFLGKAIR